MKKTLVFGASLKSNRYSNLAVKRLMAYNIETEAFGLKAGKINELQIKNYLNDFQNIHTITLYIGAARQPEYYEDFLKINPKRVLFNPVLKTQPCIRYLKTGV